MGQACCKRCCPRRFSSSSGADSADRGPGTEVFLGSLQSPQNRAALAASAEEELRVNVIVYGECSVGKTCLRNRFVEGRYTPEVQATTGVDFNIKTLQWTPIGPHGPGNPHRVKVSVHDTSGRQGFRRINANYLRAFEAVVFVYDVTRESTLTALKEFIQEPMTQASLSSNRGAVILVGSKSDVAANERQCTSNAAAFTDTLA
eukprot:21320-Heterococcus_DN1.PRE.1